VIVVGTLTLRLAGSQIPLEARTGKVLLNWKVATLTAPVPANIARAWEMVLGGD